jgi:hypothetical protein
VRVGVVRYVVVVRNEIIWFERRNNETERNSFFLCVMMKDRSANDAGSVKKHVPHYCIWYIGTAKPENADKKAGTMVTMKEVSGRALVPNKSLFLLRLPGDEQA